MKKFYRLKVKDIYAETENAVVVEFEVPEELRETFKFIHGQHLILRKDIQGKELRRTYSLCSAPSENCYRVAIKHIEEGKFSTYANEELSKGDYIEVMPPQGRFYTELNPQNEKRYVAFATGSGITPLMSIIKAILDTEPKSEFILFYGNSNRNTIIFREELADLKNIYMDRLSVYHILSRENSGPELLSGRIDEEKVKKLLAAFAQAETIDEVFICGVYDMLFTVKGALESLNIEPAKIHYELFTSPDGDLGKKHSTHSTKSRDIAADESLVSVRLDGTEYNFPLSYEDTNILDATIAEGGDPPYSCKSGVCSTCKAKLLEGKVDMDANYALEDDEVAAGYILTCQSHPVTDKVKVSYDDV